MRSINQWYAIGSDKRFQRIRQLLKDTPRPYIIDDSLNWLTDRQVGLYNSIFRDFTLSSWLTAISANGNSRVFVELSSPAQPFLLYRLDLNAKFWENKKKIQPYTFKPSDFKINKLNAKQPCDVSYSIHTNTDQPNAHISTPSQEIMVIITIKYLLFFD